MGDWPALSAAVHRRWLCVCVGLPAISAVFVGGQAVQVGWVLPPGSSSVSEM